MKSLCALRHATRRVLAALACTFVCLEALAAQPASRPERPNIIFILADDLGYGDLGCYGQKRIKTPNLDQMAAQGIRFTQCYSGSTVCAPSRCCLMTGLHTGHARVRGNGAAPLESQDFTVAQLLKGRGYATALIGKWGLGGEKTSGAPNLKGFDLSFGYLSQTHAHDYYTDHLFENGQKVMLEPMTYSCDLFTSRALEYLRAPRQQPFFLYLTYTIPHANNALGAKTGNGMEVPSDAPYSGQSWPQPEKNFAAMVTRMDSDIGRLFGLLKELGMDDKTLVFFASDNGPHREGKHSSDFFDSNGPLRGIKRDLYEGGIRVPMIVRWPGVIGAGQVSDQPWAFWDFLPTVAEIAGAEPPKDLDGKSVVAALQGKTLPAGHPLYWEFFEKGFHQAVRLDNWKAVRHGLNASMELYDLSKDVGEQTNVASGHADVVARCEGLMRSMRSDSPQWPTSASDEGTTPAKKRKKKH